jgi:uncharacterized protein (TIRG00374 family)
VVRHGVEQGPPLSQSLRTLLTLVVTGLCTAYVLWKIDLGQTAHVLGHARLGYFFAAVAINTLAVGPMAWRWQRLLAARGVRERLPWLTGTYFVSYAVGQVLPTSVGGDAARIVAGTRRHPGRVDVFTGSVLLERALGGAATLTLAAIGFALAIGRYDVGPYLWLEGALLAATILGGFVLFSRRMRRPLAMLVPLLRKLRLERPLRIVYDGFHGYRAHARVVIGAFVLTLAVQSVRVCAIWLVGKSVGVNLSLRPYYVMGPLLFLVMLVPFTVNGIAIREAFFVSFLGRLGVAADPAFATGFLFFLLAVVVSAPGAVLIATRGLSGRTPGLRGSRRSSPSATSPAAPAGDGTRHTPRETP